MSEPTIDATEPVRSVAIVGTGAVAQALGRALHRRGHPVRALAGRDPDRAARAAAFVGSNVRVVPLAEVPVLADRVLLAVSDHAVAMVAGGLADAGMCAGTVLHTSGGLGLEPLRSLAAVGVAIGVLHPLQTIATPEQGANTLEGITYAVMGDDMALRWAEAIAHLLDSHVVRVPPDSTAVYHAGAVLASNAVVAVLDAAVTLLRDAGFDRRSALTAIGPLSRTTLANVLSHDTDRALTGPVARGDADTVARHVAALPQHAPEVVELYRAISHYLVGVAQRRGLPASHARAVDAALATSPPAHPEGGLHRADS